LLVIEVVSLATTEPSTVWFPLPEVRPLSVGGITDSGGGKCDNPEDLRMKVWISNLTDSEKGGETNVSTNARIHGKGKCQILRH
jgi:hypothetical protein